MRGHSEVMYLEMVAMGIGGWMMYTGDLVSGGILFAIGAAVHFALGGFATGF